ncbi:DUF302 domain-containing protein [Halomonas sp. LS-001]
MSFPLGYTLNRTRLLAPLFLGAGILLSTPAMADDWPESGWQVMPSEHSYTQLLEQLRSAVSEANMFIVTEAGPTDAAAQRGIELPGNRVIGVFRNDYAVNILRQSVPAMIEAPLRFYVTEDADGSATLAWKEPSAVFSPYINANTGELTQIATELDELFLEIGQDALKATP